MIDLDGLMKRGKGFQALPGVTGLGLPAVNINWLEGAGDGATYRGQRVLPRDIDLPLYIDGGGGHAALQKQLDELSMALAGPCKLHFLDDSGVEWETEVVRVGGGNYVYGENTTGNDLFMVITLRAGDPFWTMRKVMRKTLKAGGGSGAFLSNMKKMKVSSSQVIGNVLIENPGTAPAYPVWVVRGPGKNFQATSPNGERFRWEGTLASGETLYIDTRTSTVRDGEWSNRYKEMAAAPRLWSVPPGKTTARVSLENTNSNSSVTVEWRPRRWMVI